MDKFGFCLVVLLQVILTAPVNALTDLGRCIYAEVINKAMHPNLGSSFAVSIMNNIRGNMDS